MADIFISYSRTDKDIAKLLADSFAAQGWSVWWDPEIPYGTQYDQVIEDELGRAKCVVVLWSERSAQSRWVRSEASRAIDRNALVPVRIDAAAEPPLEFTKIQTADLAGWSGDLEDPTFKGLVRSIARVVRPAGPTAQADAPTFAQKASVRAPKRRRLVLLALLAAPTVLAVGLAVIAMQIRRPTAFDLDLTVTGLTFVSAADQPVQLLDKSAFSRLSLHGIDRGLINAERAVLDEEEADAATTALPAAAPKPIPLPVRFAARGGDGAAAIFASPGAGGSQIGELDRLFVPPGARVALRVTPENPPALSLRVLDRPLRIVLSLRDESLVDLLGAEIESTSGGEGDNSGAMLRIESADSGSLAELTGAPAGPTVMLTPPSGNARPVMLPTALRVSALEFLIQGATGERNSSVSGEGSIAFPDARGAAGISVREGEYVLLGELHDFFIRKLSLRSNPAAIRIEAGGVADSLSTGPPGGVRERALTWFDWVWHQPHGVQLLGLAAWLLPTTLAGYRLMKERRP